MTDLEKEMSLWSAEAQNNVKNMLNKPIVDSKQEKEIEEVSAKAQMKLMEILKKAMLIKLAGKMIFVEISITNLVFVSS